MFTNYLALRKAALTKMQRACAIQMIIELQMFREYSVNTMFMAVAIFDRYMYQVSISQAKSIDSKYINTFLCTCLLIAAKFE